MTKTNYFRVSAALLALTLGALLSVVVIALTAPPAKAETTECTGSMTGTFDNIVVPKGESCELTNSTVKGNVTALKNSTLEARDNTIRGNVKGKKADTVDLQSLDPLVPDVVKGNISINKANELALVCGQTLPSGSIEIKKSRPEARGGGVGDDEFCPVEAGGGGNILKKGDVKVKDNAVGVNLGVDQNEVEGDILVLDNSGMGNKTVAFNVVGEDLLCEGNEEPFLSLSNEVGGENDCPEMQ